MNLPEWPEAINGERVPYELSLEQLTAVATGPAPLRWPAFYAIGRVGTQRALDLLGTFAQDHDPHVRRTAIEVLGRFSGQPHVESLLLRALCDADGPVVRSACGIAGENRLDAARPILRELAVATDIHTRIAAVQALAKLGHHDDIDVAESLMAGRDEAGQKEGAFACRSLVSQFSWRRLAGTWSSDRVPRHRLWAVELLGKFGAPQDVLALDGLSVDPDGHVRKAAKLAVAAIRGRAG